ncbi:hypothetical protein ACFL6U_29620 [Planctomycetota bacterium]
MKKEIAMVFTLFAFVNAAVVAEPTQKEILDSHNKTRQERFAFMKDGKFGMFILQKAVVLGNLSGLKPEKCIIRPTATLTASSDIEISVPGTYTIKMKLKDDIRQYFPLR